MKSEKWAQYSWALYDWANSAFATTVMAGFFPLFFKSYWADSANPTHSTFFLGIAGLRSLLYANDSADNNNRSASLFRAGKAISRHSRLWYNWMDSCRHMYQFTQYRNGSSTDVAGCSGLNTSGCIQFFVAKDPT